MELTAFGVGWSVKLVGFCNCLACVALRYELARSSLCCWVWGGYGAVGCDGVMIWSRWSLALLASPIPGSRNRDLNCEYRLSVLRFRLGFPNWDAPTLANSFYRQSNCFAALRNVTFVRPRASLAFTREPNRSIDFGTNG
jgi:hypothetical protein